MAQFSIFSENLQKQVIHKKVSLTNCAVDFLVHVFALVDNPGKGDPILYVLLLPPDSRLADQE